MIDKIFISASDKIKIEMTDREAIISEMIAFANNTHFLSKEQMLQTIIHHLIDIFNGVVSSITSDDIIEKNYIILDGIVYNDTSLSIYDDRHTLIASILLKKPDGNCIDFFIKSKITPYIREVSSIIDKMSYRNKDRAKLASYHSSNIFESDFNDLCKTRDYLKQMIHDIDRKLEDLTLTDYT